MPPADLPRGNAAPRPAPSAPPSRAVALQAFHHEEAQSHVPAVATRNVNMGQRAAAKIPTPQATAQTAFHHEEAQSHVPAVAAHNSALAKQAVTAYDRHQLALQLMAHAHAIGQTDPRSMSPELYKQYQSAHADHGIGGTLGSILNPIAAAVMRTPGDIHADVNALANLGERTIQGGSAIASAGFHDITHPTTWGLNPLGGGVQSGSQLGALTKQASYSDPALALLERGPSDALHVAAHNPLNAVLDALSGAGVAGRVLGTVARTGAMGDKLAETASLDRAPLAMPGGVAPVVRRGSNNLFKNVALKTLDKHDINLVPPGIRAARLAHEFRVRGDEHQLISQDLEARYETAARQKAKAAGLGPELTARKVKQAQGDARYAAMMDTLEQNAIRNKRNGGVFFGASTKPKAAAALRAQGHEFVRVNANKLLRANDNRGSVWIHKDLFDRLQAHRALDTLNTPWSVPMMRLQRLFRESVLPFSSKWITGNMGEGGGRLGLHGIGPQHILPSHQLLSDMRKAGLHTEADRLEAQALQGTHFSLNKRLDRELTNVQRTGKTLPTKAVLGAVHGYHKIPDTIFDVNSKGERQLGHAVLGKHISQTNAMLRARFPDITPDELRVLRTQYYADPRVAAHAGRMSRRILGKYGAFSPKGRSFVRTLAPFSPWYANAAKFMGTLPLRHPIFTDATTAAANATDPQWQKEHAGVKGLGGSLLASPVTSPNHYLDIGRYSPMGAFTQGTGLPPGAALAADFGPVLGPQFADILKSGLLGIDPFNQLLQYPGAPNTPTKSGRPRTAKSHHGTLGHGDWLTALSQALAQSAGPANLLHRVLIDRGGTAYNTEKLWDLNPQMKSGATPFDAASVLAGLNRVLNPFRATVVNPHPKKGTKGRSGSGFGGGGGGFGGGGFGGRGGGGF